MSRPNHRSRLSRSGDARLANLLGALSTGLTDGVQEAMSAASQVDDGAATALIALLDFSPRGSVQTLSQVLGLTHSGTVRLVDRLVNAGYVARTPGRDARSHSPRLTTTGAKVARRVRVAHEGAIAHTLGTLSDVERATLTRLCERLVSAITRQRLAQRAAGVTPAGGALCRMCDFTACGRDKGTCPAAEAAAALTPSTVPDGRSQTIR
jgi:MarR family transcriptional regulator, negative regulator of the multidrug operon emrRAB